MTSYYICAQSKDREPGKGAYYVNAPFGNEVSSEAAKKFADLKEAAAQLCGIVFNNRLLGVGDAFYLIALENNGNPRKLNHQETDYVNSIVQDWGSEAKKMLRKRNEFNKMLSPNAYTPHGERESTVTDTAESVVDAMKFGADGPGQFAPADRDDLLKRIKREAARLIPADPR